MKTIIDYLVPILSFLGMTIARDRAGTIVRIEDDTFFYWFHLASPIILMLWIIWKGSKFMGKFNTYKKEKENVNNNTQRCR